MRSRKYRAITCNSGMTKFRELGRRVAKIGESPGASTKNQRDLTNDCPSKDATSFRSGTPYMSSIEDLNTYHVNKLSKPAFYTADPGMHDISRSCKVKNLTPATPQSQQGPHPLCNDDNNRIRIDIVCNENLIRRIGKYSLDRSDFKSFL